MFLLLACLQKPKTSEAAGQYVKIGPWDTPTKVGDVTFITKEQGAKNYYRTKLKIKKNGKNTTISRMNVGTFLTNGKLLYYSESTEKIDEESWKNTIYCYNIKSGKKTKITAGTNYVLNGCNGTYLYCGEDFSSEGINLYALNLKTKKKEHMVSGVGSVTIFNRTIITTTNSGDADNYPIYRFHLNGSGKKKIDDGAYLLAKKNIFYYIKYKYPAEKKRVYRYSVKTGKKKAVTKWIDTIPEKYLPVY